MTELLTYLLNSLTGFILFHQKLGEFEDKPTEDSIEV